MVEPSQGEWECATAGNVMEGPAHGRLCSGTEFRLLTISKWESDSGF